MKQFQQLSLCSVCEKSSLILTVKSMLGSDVHCNSTVRLVTPHLSPVLPEGHKIKRSLITVWRLTFWFQMGMVSTKQHL